MNPAVRWLHTHNDHCAAGDLGDTPVNIKRLLNPNTNLPGYQAGIAAVIAVVTGLTHHHSVPAVTYVAAGWFMLSVVQWFRSTPVSDPKDSKGRQLAPVIQVQPPATTTGSTP